MDDNASLDTLLDAAIPVLSNHLILRLLEADCITIDPFDANKLAPTAYHICPHRLRFHTEDEDGIILADRAIRLHEGEGRDLRPGEYAVVSPRERITLTDGFVADFFPASWCVENKLVLTAGRLDAGYDGDLVFGVFNAGRLDVRLTRGFQLARVTFGWLGPGNTPVYTGRPPGAYIPELTKLRKREEDLDSAEQDLRRQKKEIARIREELLSQAEATKD